MLISCNKLKTHIKDSDKIDFYKIWDKFTIRTAEVESVEIKGNNFDKVITAKILKCKKHPKSNKLSLLTVTDGKEEYEVVCGAPNVKEGLIGAFIQVGGHIDDMQITPRPILDEISHGMMCSEKELGISDNHEGIIQLPENTPLGVDIKQIIPVEDIIVEIDNKSLTNRPDLWGHYGIAREIAAITGHKLKPLELEEESVNKDKLNIKIINPELCYRYVGVKLDNITNKETPMWMKLFLNYAGMRSINLIVDLTNYIMLELGQPMHAFDSKVVKEIEIGLAKDKDTFTTLDNVKRNLTKEDLMIKSGGNYFGAAGVMGGLESEIEEETTSLILESAAFEASTVRKTATRLGLRSEASSRYEKSLDPNLSIIATRRFIKLLKDHNPNLSYGSSITDVYPEEFKEIKIKLNKDLLNKYMGTIVPDEKIIKILESLEFKVQNNKEYFDVIVPTFRATKDITIEQDLIEEIARMYGYENFTPEPLNMDLTFENRENLFEESLEIKEYLANKYNLHEVHTYLWNETDFLKDLNIDINNVKLLGKSKDNILRDDIALSLLEKALVNTKNYKEERLFEIGTTIIDNKNERHLGILLSSDSNNLEKTYNEAKEITYNLIYALKNKKITFKEGTSKNYYNQNLTQNIIHEETPIGQIKVFNQTIANKINKKKTFVIIDINMDKYQNIKHMDQKYSEISKYPTTNIDYTIQVDKTLEYKDFKEKLDRFKNDIIKDIKLIDIYIEEKVKNITISFTVGSNERTLTKEDTQNLNDNFMKFLEKHNLNITK